MTIEFDAAKAELETAKRNFESAAKEELGALLSGIFDDEEIRDIGWGMKYGEYDDQGLYPGINGPVVNKFSDEDGNLDWSDWWEILYDRDGTGNGNKTLVAHALRDVLESIGAELLCSILKTYDEQVVIVHRDERENAGFAIETIDAAY